MVSKGVYNNIKIYVELQHNKVFSANAWSFLPEKSMQYP